MSEIHVPIGIHRDDHQVVLTWAEGEETAFPARSLRLACQCAVCRDEMSGRLLLDAKTVPDDVKPLSISLVGGYGFRIRWSDGHDTGIYTYESLYETAKRHGG